MTRSNLLNLAQNDQANSRARDLVLFGIALALTQALDAVLTMFGVHHFGTTIEANIALRHLMEAFNPVHVLACTKITAIAVVVTTTILAKRSLWGKQGIEFVSGLYVGSAVLPWLYVIIWNGVLL